MGDKAILVKKGHQENCKIVCFARKLTQYQQPSLLLSTKAQQRTLAPSLMQEYVSYFLNIGPMVLYIPL